MRCVHPTVKFGLQPLTTSGSTQEEGSDAPLTSTTKGFPAAADALSFTCCRSAASYNIPAITRAPATPIAAQPIGPVTARTAMEPALGAMAADAIAWAICGLLAEAQACCAACETTREYP